MKYGKWPGDIHEHYDKLKANEKELVNDVTHHIINRARLRGIPMAGDDRCERAVDSIALWIIQSRTY